MTIGVLSLQGSVAEHLKLLDKCKKAKCAPVKTVEAINAIDGLIIPGGESTTLMKLIKNFGLYEPIKQRIDSGMPVWGTCAGMILLANKIEGALSFFNSIDIAVKRNAYGRQTESFFTEGDFEGVGHIGMVFVRAPKITRLGSEVQALAYHNDEVVAARSGNVLVTAFHPEMIPTDPRVHKYFVNMCEEAAKNVVQ